MGFDTFAAIKIHIMERALEDSEETDGDFSTLAEDAIVQSHRDFAMRWPILEWRKDPPGAFLTVDDITTTTITAAIGEAVTATLSTAPSDSIQGRKIQPTGEEWYARVTSHAAGRRSVHPSRRCLRNLPGRVQPSYRHWGSGGRAVVPERPLRAFEV
jgi:hypothetical protein